MDKVQAIDFFCGAGGMSFGLSCTKIDVLAGIDNDSSCQETYEHKGNGIGSTFLNQDIMSLKLNRLEQMTGIEKWQDNLLFTGCSPCQYWSKINTDKTKAAKKKNLLERFGEFVQCYQPGYVMIENVPGLRSKQNEKVLERFHRLLQEMGYNFDDNVVNVADYGVPQKRRRYLLIASRLGNEIMLPRNVQVHKEMTVRAFIGDENTFPRVEAGHRDKTSFAHTVSRLSNKNLRRIRKTDTDGGTRLSWADDPELQIPAYEGKDDQFVDVYGRMKWDEPAPTITTRFHSLSNGRFGHPEQDRAISLREGATLQTFPLDFVFEGGLLSKARQIGNAVPPRLAEELGKQVIAHFESASTSHSEPSVTV